MFELKYGGKTYEVRFGYGYNEIIEDGKIINKKPVYTACFIIAEDRAITGYGISWCNPSDIFSKFVGRKLALTRAVKELDKDFRKTIWDKYFSITKKQ